MVVNPYHHRMLFTSYSFLLTALIAAYHDLDYLFWVDIFLFLTSVNYWRYPLKDWRRNIDILMVIITIFCHYLAINDYTDVVLIFVIVGLYSTCKISSDKNLSSICHSLMHIITACLFIKSYETLEVSQ